jgi:hypothetical protein
MSQNQSIIFLLRQGTHCQFCCDLQVLIHANALNETQRNRSLRLIFTKERDIKRKTQQPNVREQKFKLSSTGRQNLLSTTVSCQYLHLCAFSI